MYLCSWLKFKYYRAAKLDTLRRFYWDKIMSLNLKSSGLLGDYIKRFQGLAILCREIDTTVQPGYRLVTQMVEQIEDPIFSGPCEIIMNWDKSK